MTAWILVWLDFIQVVILLPPVPVEVLTDIRQRLFQRIRSDTPVGKSQFHTRSIDIILEPHTKTLFHILHHITQRTGIVSRIVILCLYAQHCCYAQPNGQNRFLHILLFYVHFKMLLTCIYPHFITTKRQTHKRFRRTVGVHQELAVFDSPRHGDLLSVDLR